MDGLLVVDKPAGLTSHDVVDVVRRLTGQRKVGHTGTLDPDATGVLVLCLGRGTRLVRFLQGGPKTYVATARLGIETDTQDAAGQVTARASSAHVTEDDVRQVFADSVGDIQQVPPMVSALKVDGERLYEKARRGEVVEREARPVTVHELTVDAFTPGDPAEVTFTVSCSAGTYVRTLAYDAGRALSCGAHLTALRRTVNGGFTLDDACTLDALDALQAAGELGSVLRPLIEVTRALPTVEVGPDEARAVAYGQPGAPRGVADAYAIVHAGRLLAIGRDQDGRGRYEAVLVRPEELETR